MRNAETHLTPRTFNSLRSQNTSSQNFPFQVGASCRESGQCKRGNLDIDCGRLNDNPPKCACPNPRSLRICCLEMDFADVIKVSIFKQGRLSRQIRCNHKGHYGGRQEYHVQSEKVRGQKQKSDKGEAAILVALKIEEGDHSRNAGSLSKLEKSRTFPQGKVKSRFSSRTSRRNSGLQTS